MTAEIKSNKERKHCDGKKENESHESEDVLIVFDAVEIINPAHER